MVAPDRDKLRRAFRVGRGGGGDGGVGDALRARIPSPHPQAADEPDLRTFLKVRFVDRAVAKRTIVELPPGEAMATPHGVLWRRELRYPLTTVHGEVPLARACRLDGGRLATIAKDDTLVALDPRQCLFLDTETTGLAGGAGTVVFAYGLGFFERDELVVEQLFLRDFGEEPAMLQHVAARLARFPVPVTFVGKSYDRHRIAARLAVHKVTAPVLTPRHVDLYHVVRRVHGTARHGEPWPDTRLCTVERRLLGVHRTDDLPGSEAPAAFLDWIRDKSGPVDRVLEHNRLDVLSLVALLGVLAGAEPDPRP